MTIITTEDGSLGVAGGEKHEIHATEWELHSFITKLYSNTAGSLSVTGLPKARGTANGIADTKLENFILIANKFRIIAKLAAAIQNYFKNGEEETETNNRFGGRDRRIEKMETGPRDGLLQEPGRGKETRNDQGEEGETVAEGGGLVPIALIQ